jgi:hypothetical protein
MTQHESNKLYAWKIRCIDRSSKTFFDREVVFNSSLARDGDELNEVLEILEHREDRSPLVRYRHVFEEVSEDELNRRSRTQLGADFFAIPDYFEDELGNGLDSSDVISIQTGMPAPVLIGDVNSVLKRGRSNMRAPSEWTVENSNDFVHLIQVLGLIGRSRWFTYGLQLSTTGNSGNYELDAPDLDSTISALALVRQFLMERDDIFKKAAELYIQQADSEDKRLWVKEEVNRFESYLNSTSRFFGPDAVSHLTNRQLIETLVYGTGLFHRRSNQNMEKELFDLEQQCDREQLVFTLNSACRHLLEAPMNAGPLFYRDFAHWTNTGQCPRPDRVVLTSLFGSMNGNE